MDTRLRGCYPGTVRVAVLLVLVLFLTAVARAEDDDDRPSSGLSKRLRSIDETAEFDADHPDRAGDDPGDVAEEPDDPLAAPPDDTEPSDAPSRGRRASARGRARSTVPAAPTGGASPIPPSSASPPGAGLESPLAISPLAPSPSGDDD